MMTLLFRTSARWFAGTLAGCTLWLTASAAEPFSGKILGIVENHPLADGTIPARDHAALVKLGRVYGKFPTARLGPEGIIEKPPEAKALRVDGQLVVVIGKRARHVSAANALDHVAGYTLGADISEAEWYRTARLVGRSPDTWAPVSDRVVTDLDPAAVTVETRVNGRLVESLATKDLVLGIAELISFFSRYNTLEPGDLIFTGSRTGSAIPEAPLQEGDLIEISGGPRLGTLRNRVGSTGRGAVLLRPERGITPATTAETESTLPTPRRFLRLTTPDGPRHGQLEGDTIHVLSDDFLAGGNPTGATLPLADATLLPPVRPRKIIGVILNYFPLNTTDRSAPLEDLPKRLFLKWPDALGTSGSAIELPPESNNLNWEGELVAVIGRTARHVPVENALDHVFGYAVGNDVSENHWGGLIGKATATWTQLGPIVATGLPWNGLRVETRVNGQLTQAQGTADLRYGVPLLIAYASRYFTLEPGDLIYSGSVQRLPNVAKKFSTGDGIEVRIDGLGTLHNHVVSMPALSLTP